ncbi:MAG: hypothetical protein QOE60_2185 [Thermoleophilaceae bacterium]|nr:hypothetical protein [Thermoleophilaceae bacterium]
MVRLLVFFREPPDPAAFERHYYETHVPLVHKIPHMRGPFVSDGPVDVDGDASKVHFAVELEFPSREALAEAFSSPEFEASRVDLDEFAGGLYSITTYDVKEA